MNLQEIVDNAIELPLPRGQVFILHVTPKCVNNEDLIPMFYFRLKRIIEQIQFHPRSLSSTLSLTNTTHINQSAVLVGVVIDPSYSEVHYPRIRVVAIAQLSSRRPVVE